MGISVVSIPRLFYIMHPVDIKTGDYSVQAVVLWG